MKRELEASKSKQEIRCRMLSQRRAMSPEVAEALSVLAQENLLKQAVWQEAKSVALYMAIQNEVKTSILLADAEKSGKKIYLPRVDNKTRGKMGFALYRGVDDLLTGFQNILELDPEFCPDCIFSAPETCPLDDPVIVPPPEIFIVPGVAFDHSGQRVGFGGGYYDRFLSSQILRKYSLFIGLAYSFQLVETLPAEAWDQSVDAVCTDLGYALLRR